MSAAAVNNTNNHPLRPRDAVTTLSALLERLYPEPVSPDILTLDDMLRRYRLTQLGSPAMRAIRQSQRINRRIGNYQSIGLCEFHIGLIFLYWGDLQGAAQQFVEARQQWAFVHQPASVCLTHFAEGMAQHLAFSPEMAMASYGKVEHLLPRLPAATPSDALGRFVTALQEALTEAQRALRHDIWTTPPPHAPSTETPPRQGPAAPPDAATDAATEPEPPPIQADAIVQQPISNLDADPNQPSCPVPAHKKINDDYQWYKVIERRDDFLPRIQDGGWVLVNTQVENYEYNPGDILIVSDEAVNGSVMVQPRGERRPYGRIFLARLEPVGTFTRGTDTQKVTFSADMEQVPVDLVNILGIVVGFWLHTIDTADLSYWLSPRE